MVDTATGNPYNDLWRHKTTRRQNPLLLAAEGGGGAGLDGGDWDDEMFLGETVAWTDVTVPFDQAAVRVSVDGHVRWGEGGSLGAIGAMRLGLA